MRAIRTILSAAAVLFAATLFPAHAAFAAPAADLSVTVSGSPNPVVVAWLVTWTVTVTNLGPDAASGVKVTIPYGSDGSPSWAKATQGSCEHVLGQSVEFDVGTIQSGAKAILTAAFIDWWGDGSRAYVGVTATTLDPDLSNNNVVGRVTTIDGPGPTSEWPYGPFCAPEGGIGAGFGGTAAGPSAAPLITLLILGLAGLTAGLVRIARR